MQVNNFFIDLAFRLLFIDLHFFIATIQIGVIVQVSLDVAYPLPFFLELPFPSSKKGKGSATGD